MVIVIIRVKICDRSLGIIQKISTFEVCYILFVQDDIQHDFAGITDEADGSVVLAEL